MLHKHRTWCLQDASDAFELSEKLTQTTWTLCTAFAVRDYLFVNDSTGPDGAQEYAVLRPNDRDERYQQIESITFSWCSEEKALALILRILAGEFDGQAMDTLSFAQFQDLHDHGICPHCA